MTTRALLVLGLGAAACSEPSELPPYGEALVIVDTDAPVPQYVGRMRLDVYTPDGTEWYESRDIPLRNPADWPATFSLFTKDLESEHAALVRVRIYPEGKVRDYHGERFTSRDPAEVPSADAVPSRPVCDPPSDCELPRLLQDGVDATPASEPHPYLAIDRLIRVRLRAGARGSVRLTLRGACFGTMADLATRRTCVDRDATLVSAAEAELDPDMSTPPAVLKDFGESEPCPDTASPRPGSAPGGVRLHDEEVCVPGGTYVFGNTNPSTDTAGPASSLPERIATIRPFYVDKYEVTVGRWRDALLRGFRPPSPAKSNEYLLERDTCASVKASSSRWCTFTDLPGVPEDREGYPLSCVDWDAAREFCKFEGSDLPTEAQWEYVAQVVGREQKTGWPWGPSAPTCLSEDTVDSMIFARLFECSGSWHQAGYCILFPPAAYRGIACGPGDGYHDNCGGSPVVNARQGPQPVDAADHDHGDRSVGLGVVNLGGGVQEYTLDSLLSLGSRCWSAAPLESPFCLDPSQAQHTVRGDSWAGVGYDSTARRALLKNAKESNRPQIGFRCARALEGG